MPDGQLCQRCQVRPAVANVRRLQEGMPPVVERLCATCLQEGHLAPPGARRGGLLDEFMAAMFPGLGAGPGAGAGGGPGAPEPVPQRPQRVDITRFFSDATRDMLRRAAHQVMEWGGLDVETDHLLFSAIESPAAVALLRRVGVEPGDVQAEVERSVEHRPPTDVAPSLSPDVKRVLLGAFEESRRLGASYLGPDHVLVALARDGDSAAGRVLARHGVDVSRLRDAAAQGPAPEEAAATTTSATPTLDQHSVDLTARAREGELDPVIGRDDEIEQAVEVLSRRTKNNPVLIGDPGVGKTAIAEGIAQRIVNGEVPDTLAGRRVVALDLAGLLAGTRYRGEFEQRLKSVIEEVTQRSGELVLFIDEVHTLVGAGAAEGAMDAANMLKPALARGDLHVIGATTLDEYRKNIERDAALERRLQPIVVDELDVEETIQVLFGLKDRYEAFHRARITDEAVDAAARLADRYVTDRFLPDKAIDLIDQAGARVRLRHGRPETTQGLRDEAERLRREKDQAVGAEDYERAAELRGRLRDLENQLEEARQGRHVTAEMTAEDVAEVVARATGIPVAQVSQVERERLVNLEKQLHQQVVGQDEAVAGVAAAIRRNRAGLGDPTRPVGGFLFLGPTGVGKTELARALARTLFGSEEHLVRFDMSEFQERHTVSRLVGAPPGYVGYEEAGQLTEQVRRRPYTVVLLDEFEKAHPDVSNILLQVLDDGRLTDGQGRTVDFRNTLVIMTSNFGAERLLAQQPIGFRSVAGRAGESAGFEEARDELLATLRREFRPEFLNRLDEVVVFRPLSQAQLLEVTGMLVRRLADRLRAQGIDLRVGDPAVAHLAERGYDPTFGARPLQRTIQRLVENPLSDRILAGEVDGGDGVAVDVVDGELRFTVDKRANGETLDDWEEPPVLHRPPTPGPVAPRSGAGA